MGMTLRKFIWAKQMLL